MNKKGLRGFIRNRLPKTWEIVLTRERKLTEKSKEGLIYWVGIYNKIKDLEHQMN